MKNEIKKYIPKNLKLSYEVLKRKIKDIFSPHSFAGKETGIRHYSFSISIKQVIMKTSTPENKIHNLQLAALQIEQVLIKPGQVFSFWRIVGNPTESEEYKKGGNFINNKLQEDIGGELSQLSGIIYHLSLKAGLQVLERFSHLVDIYTEEERFTPLGADAAVSYGYKDLKVKNTYSFPLYFSFTITSDFIEAILHSSEELPPVSVVFKCTEYKNKTEIFTWVNHRTVAVSVYKKS